MGSIEQIDGLVNLGGILQSAQSLQSLAEVLRQELERKDNVIQHLLQKTKSLEEELEQKEAEIKMQAAAIRLLTKPD
ncbi:hypothetical protein HDE_04269 [Halotydeus destructor]|nr:hypothetical protein HDE_04269 [Halotydeus destructor]